MAAKEGGTARPYERDADGLRVDVRALSRERAKLSETQRELEHGLEKLEVQQRDTAEQLRSAQRFMIPKENRLKDVCSDVEVENAQRLLDKLPEEVWEKILGELENDDLFPLALSRRYFRQKQKELVARAKQNGKPRPTLKTTLTRTFHLKHIVKLPASAEYIKFCMKEEEFLDDTENVRCLQCLALLHGHLPLLQDQDFLDPDDIIRGLWITAAAGESSIHSLFLFVWLLTSSLLRSAWRPTGDLAVAAPARGYPGSETFFSHCQRRRQFGDDEVAQKRGLPLGSKRMLGCSWGWSLGGIEVAQERGLPLE